MRELFSRKGFTLIELIFVVLVLGIIMGIALFRPGFDLTVKYTGRTTAQRLVSDLRLTRRLAISNSEDYRLTVYPVASEYKIFDSANVQVGPTRSVESGITLSGDTNFIFESFGNASSGTGLSVAVGGNEYNISIVQATGMVSITDEPSSGCGA